MGIVRVFDPIALKRAQIVGIPQFATEFLEQLPIPLLTLASQFLLQETLEVDQNPVRVEQGIVDIDQKDDVTVCREVTHEKYV
jgi:hypothetical protein